MTHQKRVSLMVLLDSIIVLCAIYIGYFTLNPYFHIYTLPTLLISSIALLISHHVFAVIYKLYYKAWSYASVGELVAIVKAVTLSIFVTGIIQMMMIGDVYVRVLGITWMLHILLIGGSRFSWRVYRDRYMKPVTKGKRTMIVGAGSAGSMVARQLLNNHESEFYPVAFVDDDKLKQRLQIYGVPVLRRNERHSGNCFG